MTIFNKWVSVLLPKSFITALLFSFYALAYIITPYWRLPASISTRLIILFFTLIAGIGWSVLSSSNLQINFNFKGWIFLFILVSILFALNYRELTSVIPWRGDEDFFFKNIMFVSKLFLEVKKWIICGLIGFLIFLILAWIKPGWAVIAGTIIILGVTFFFLRNNPFSGRRGLLLRYPFINYWFASIVPAIASIFTDPYHEILYRVIPILFVGALAWVFQSSLPISNTVTKFILAISVATIPLVFYYSSIFYLEMPAVFLMMVVCFRIKNLLNQNVVQLKRNPGWYCLILIGFIKETAIPFLLFFLFSRWIVQILQIKPWRHPISQGKSALEDAQKSPMKDWIIGEMGIAFSVLFPAFLFQALRIKILPSTSRTFGFNWINLLKPQAYIAYGHSFIDQFGIYLLFFFAGCILLIKNKEYATVGFILMVFIGFPLFYIVDNWIYAGYSRFNLFVIPPILAGASGFLTWMFERKKKFGLGITCLAIFISLVISPINMDGTKKPYWDSYNTDTAEHYYPYREAIYWLKQTYPLDHVLPAGLYYKYDGFDFYSVRFNYHNLDSPDNLIWRHGKRESDTTALANALVQAEKRKDQIILFHVLGNEVPQLVNTGNFHLEKVFRNSAHILVVYRRITPG